MNVITLVQNVLIRLINALNVKDYIEKQYIILLVLAQMDIMMSGLKIVKVNYIYLLFLFFFFYNIIWKKIIVLKFFFFIFRMLIFM